MKTRSSCSLPSPGCFGEVAQLVEHTTENRGVASSILALAIPGSAQTGSHASHSVLGSSSILALAIPGSAQTGSHASHSVLGSSSILALAICRLRRIAWLCHRPPRCAEHTSETSSLPGGRLARQLARAAPSPCFGPDRLQFDSGPRHLPAGVGKGEGARRQGGKALQRSPSRGGRRGRSPVQRKRRRGIGCQDGHLHARLRRVERLPDASQRRGAAHRRLRARPRRGRVAPAGHAGHPRPRAARGLARHHPAVPHLLRDLRRRAESAPRPGHGRAG